MPDENREYDPSESSERRFVSRDSWILVRLKPPYLNNGISRFFNREWSKLSLGF